MIAANEAVIYYEPESRVISRTGGKELLELFKYNFFLNSFFIFYLFIC